MILMKPSPMFVFVIPRLSLQLGQLVSKSYVIKTLLIVPKVHCIQVGRALGPNQLVGILGTEIAVQI